MDLKRKFNNREISWLSFNERVLQEAEDPNTPIFERIRFIGIFSNNLDEFFRVRVANVRRMVDFGEDEENLLGETTPLELYVKILKVVVEQQKKVQEVFLHIFEELRKEDIYLINERELSEGQGKFVRNYFNETILPNLVPIMLSPEMKFPYLRDRSVYLAVKLSRSDNPEIYAYSLIRVPSRLVSRFLVLPQEGEKQFVILLDDIIRFCLNGLFCIFDYDVHEAFTVKLTRDAELDIDDDISKSFIQKMEASLKKRKIGRPVRIIYDRDIPKDLLKFIMKKMKLDKNEHGLPGGRYHNHKDFMDFPEIGRPEHYYQKLPSLRHKDLPPNTSILKIIRQKDVMLHFPYQTFGHFIDLLREAAIDPKVKEIGITIYRVAPYSRVVNALLNAIRNGKKVTVVIELQARFDEEANIDWSNKLQEEGAQVINGIPGLKIHCKLTWIQRLEDDGLKNYAYIGTGNFHEGTARVYADDGLLTSDPKIANEVANIFDFFKHNYKSYNYGHLVVSPFGMREYFTALVENEMALAKEGKSASMILKMNSLIDPGMMNLLYKAGKAGVKIQLIVRGIYGMKTGPNGIGKNIEAISIVDKYLEHSRIFVFANNGEKKYFITSADWMPRNLNRRIEVACPVYDPGIRDELEKMLMIQLQDNTKARILGPEMKNVYNRNGVEKKYRSQEDYYNYIREITLSDGE